MRTLSRPASPARRIAAQSSRRRAHVGDRGQAEPSSSSCALASASSRSAAVGAGIFVSTRPIAASTNRPVVPSHPFDLAAGGPGRGGDAGRLQRRAVDDRRMAVDASSHDRPVGDHGVEIGGGREALVRPHFLVPAAADDPAAARIGRGIGLQPLLQFGERSGAGEVELQRSRCPSAHHMAVRVDQAGQQCAARRRRSRVRSARRSSRRAEQLRHLAVVADQQRR